MTENASAEGLAPAIAQHLKIETVSSAADAAASALELDSDGVPEDLKCPICEEVPLGEVYQCPNGHAICKECQTKSGRLICAQCNKAMRTGDGDWIRNRVLENLLNSLWIACPFRKNGCQEILHRGDVPEHKEKCIFGGNCVQICKYFGESGKNCQYWIQSSKPDEAVEHLKTHLCDITRTEEWCWLLPVASLCPDLMDAAVTKFKGGTFMTIGWNDGKSDQVSFVCMRMDKPSGQEEPTTVTLSFDTKKPDSKMPIWNLAFPIVSVLEVKPILERKMKMVSVPRPLLEDNYSEPEYRYEGFVRVNIKIS